MRIKEEKMFWILWILSAGSLCHATEPLIVPSFGAVFSPQGTGVVSGGAWFHSIQFLLPQTTTMSTPTLNCAFTVSDASEEIYLHRMCTRIQNDWNSYFSFLNTLLTDLNHYSDDVTTFLSDLQGISHVASSRSKRSLISWLMHDIFGIATTEEIDKVGKASEDIKEALSKQQNEISGVARQVVSLSSQMDSRLKTTWQGVQENHNMVLNMSVALMSRLNTIAQQTQTSLTNLFVTMQNANLMLLQYIEIIQNGTILAQKTSTTLTTMKMELNQLLTGYLPESKFHPTFMKEILDTISKNVQTQLGGQFRPLITRETYQRMYSMRCVILGAAPHGMLVTIRMPLVYLEQPFIIYKLHTYPVPMNSSSQAFTIIRPAHQYIGVNSLYQISTDDLHEAGWLQLDEQSKIYEIRGSAISALTKDNCEVDLLEGRPATTVARDCKIDIVFSIKPRDPVYIGLGKWLIQQVTADWKQNCPPQQTTALKPCTYCIIVPTCGCTVMGDGYIITPQGTMCQSMEPVVQQFSVVNMLGLIQNQAVLQLPNSGMTIMNLTDKISVPSLGLNKFVNEFNKTADNLAAQTLDYKKVVEHYQKTNQELKTAAQQSLAVVQSDIYDLKEHTGTGTSAFSSMGFMSLSSFATIVAIINSVVLAWIIFWKFPTLGIAAAMVSRIPMAALDPIAHGSCANECYQTIRTQPWSSGSSMLDYGGTCFTSLSLAGTPMNFVRMEYLYVGRAAELVGAQPAYPLLCNYENDTGLSTLKSQLKALQPRSLPYPIIQQLTFLPLIKVQASNTQFCMKNLIKICQNANATCIVEKEHILQLKNVSKMIEDVGKAAKNWSACPSHPLLREAYVFLQNLQTHCITHNHSLPLLISSMTEFERLGSRMESPSTCAARIRNKRVIDSTAWNALVDQLQCKQSCWLGSQSWMAFFRGKLMDQMQENIYSKTVLQPTIPMLPTRLTDIIYAYQREKTTMRDSEELIFPLDYPLYLLFDEGFRSAQDVNSYLRAHILGTTSLTENWANVIAHGMVQANLTPIIGPISVNQILAKITTLKGLHKTPLLIEPISNNMSIIEPLSLTGTVDHTAAYIIVGLVFFLILVGVLIGIWWWRRSDEYQNDDLRNHMVNPNMNEPGQRMRLLVNRALPNQQPEGTCRLVIVLMVPGQYAGSLHRVNILVQYVRHTSVMLWRSDNRRGWRNWLCREDPISRDFVQLVAVPRNFQLYSESQGEFAQISQAVILRPSEVVINPLVQSLQPGLIYSASQLICDCFDCGQVVIDEHSGSQQALTHL